MTSVIEYAITAIGAVCSVDLPYGAQVLGCGDKPESDPVFWAKGNDTQSPVSRRFIVHPTGEDIPLIAGLEQEFAGFVYIGSFVRAIDSVPTQCHLFEVAG